MKSLLKSSVLGALTALSITSVQTQASDPVEKHWYLNGQVGPVFQSGKVEGETDGAIREKGQQHYRNGKPGVGVYFGHQQTKEHLFWSLAFGVTKDFTKDLKTYSTVNGHTFSNKLEKKYTLALRTYFGYLHVEDYTAHLNLQLLLTRFKHQYRDNLGTVRPVIGANVNSEESSVNKHRVGVALGFGMNKPIAGTKYVLGINYSADFYKKWRSQDMRQGRGGISYTAVFKPIYHHLKVDLAMPLDLDWKVPTYIWKD